MATTRMVEQILQTNFGRFFCALIYAIAEWVVIVLLFIDGLLSFITTEIAHFFELKLPCLLCSRIDHILMERDPGYYYRELICEAHGEQVSSLAYCHIHRKLADIHKMCQGCLLSFATENKSNSEIYRLLVGISGADLECTAEEDRSICSKLPNNGEKGRAQGNFDRGAEAYSKTHLNKSSERSANGYCSCCNEPLRIIGSYSQRLYRMVSGGGDLAREFPVPSTVAVDQESLTKKIQSYRTRSKEPFSFDPLSNIGYVELKVTSDTESEIPEEDDQLSAVVSEGGVSKEDMLGQFLPTDKSKSLSSQSLSMITNSVLTTRVPEACAAVQDEQLRFMECDLSARGSLARDLQRPLDESISTMWVNLDQKELKDIGLGHSLEELNWVKDPPSAPANVVEAVIDKRNSDPRKPIGAAALSVNEIMDLNDVYKMATTTPRTPTRNFEGNLDIRKPNGEAALSMNEIMDLNDVYKMATTTPRTPTFGNPFFDLLFGKKETCGAQEDAKSATSQQSISQGLGQPWADMGPAIHGYSDDLRASSTPSPTGFQAPPQKRLSIEGNGSGMDSQDGSILGEVDGESMVERLKRQIRLHRRSLIALYKELEEERSASAIAANQAMAMITRLQEEKATVQMEALQYQRMMEEQAEYDQDALQVMNELLIKREKEIKVLEVDLESCRQRFRYELAEELEQDERGDSIGNYRKFGGKHHSEMGSRDDRQSGMLDGYHRLKSHSASSISEKSEYGSLGHRDQTEPGNETGVLDNLLLDFENERLYILERLEAVKKKFHSCSNNREDLNTGRGEICDERIVGEHSPRSSVRDMLINKENLNGHSSAINDEAHWDKVDENSHLGSLDSLGFYMVGRDYVNSGRGEMSRLDERLEALEADKEFLKHAVKSLQRGGEGAQLLQEIAQHLRELRQLETRPSLGHDYS